MMPPPAATTHHQKRRRSSQQKVVRAMIVCSLLSWTCASAFTPISVSSSAASRAAVTDSTSSRHPSTATTSSSRSAAHLQLFASPTKKHSPLEDEPWKNDDSYWDQLQIASKDPEQFEKFIEETMAKKKGLSSSSTSSSSLSSAYASAAKQQEEEKPKKKKGGYVPIEQWDAQRSNKENMSAEERLQWECQRGGNQLRQNEILVHNLNSF